jgi:hypothetical protein
MIFNRRDTETALRCAAEVRATRSRRPIAHPVGAPRRRDAAAAAERAPGHRAPSRARPPEDRLRRRPHGQRPRILGQRPPASRRLRGTRTSRSGRRFAVDGSTPYGRDSAGASAERILTVDKRPSAIFAASDMQAVGLLDAAHHADLCPTSLRSSTSTTSRSPTSCASRPSVSRSPTLAPRPVRRTARRPETPDRDVEDLMLVPRRTA